jgi:hypothetical protein
LTTTSSPVRSTARCTCQNRATRCHEHCQNGATRCHEHALDDLLAGAQPDAAPLPLGERCYQYPSAVIRDWGAPGQARRRREAAGRSSGRAH